MKKIMYYGLTALAMLMFYGNALAVNTGSGNGQGQGNGAGQGSGISINSVVVSPAPEPPIMVLLGGGALLGAYWLRKKSLRSSAHTS
ncbi:MAG: PEP-CTERM sorting domain-containing protein [Chlorobiaceae bacterium]|nr:PEP-CTERM sorting domain-containing protein [Chlorobiaceae bacterium]